MRHSVDIARRNLIFASTLGRGTGMMTRPVAATSGAIDEGRTSGERVTFAPIHADTERPDDPPPNPDPPERRIGFAIMGLGRLALENILPAAIYESARLGRPVKLTPTTDRDVYRGPEPESDVTLATRRFSQRRFT